MKYSNGPGTFSPIYALAIAPPTMSFRRWRYYFQGVGGTGAPPFFHGVGGTGAPPFFHGVGGTGAPPFAMITAPLSCAVTTVFRLMAPTKINMARRITVSLRDIVECLRGMRNTTREVLYQQIQQCQAARRASLCQTRYRVLGSGLSPQIGLSASRPVPLPAQVRRRIVV